MVPKVINTICTINQVKPSGTIHEEKVPEKTENHKHKHKHKYHDPLNKKIPVLMSYSNEIGTAISEIAPRLGAALWAPTFMYLGADIYDKYKNDKDNYKPSGKRALKRAIFQGMTSLIALPAVIFAAQSAISPLAQLDQWGINGNTKDAVYKHTKSVIAQAHGTALDSYEEFNNAIKTTLENKIRARRNEKKTANIFKRFWNKLFTQRYVLLSADKAQILTFAEANAKKTFDILTALKNEDKKNIPHRIYKKYKKTLPTIREMYKDADYSHQATRHALIEYQKSLIFKNKMLKTFGGFTALILLANPINNFVDKQIMKRFINPGIDQISKNLVYDTKMKTIFSNMEASKSTSDKNANSSNLLQRLKNQRELKSKAVEKR